MQLLSLKKILFFNDLFFPDDSVRMPSAPNPTSVPSTVVGFVENIQLFLRSRFHPESERLFCIGRKGDHDAYSFYTPEGSYVIRVGADLESFRKDKLAYHLFSAPDLPIPKTLDLGKFNKQDTYSITECMAGKPIDVSEREYTDPRLSSLIRVVEAMRRSKLPQTAGFGPLNGVSKSCAFYKTWKSYLLGVYEESLVGTSSDGEVFRNGDVLYQEAIQDRKLFEKAYYKMQELLPLCPEEKYLIHGNFTLANLLAEQDQITGVLGWADMSCGDFLYDIASVEYYSGHQYAQAFKAYYLDRQMEVPNLEERILCYKIHVGVKNMCRCISHNQYQQYKQEASRLAALLR